MQSRAESIVAMLVFIAAVVYMLNVERWGPRGVWLVVSVIALGSAYLVGLGLRTGNTPMVARYGIGLAFLFIILFLFPNIFG